MREQPSLGAGRAFDELKFEPVTDIEVLDAAGVEST